MHKVGIGSLSEIKDVRYHVHLSVKNQIYCKINCITKSKLVSKPVSVSFFFVINRRFEEFRTYLLKVEEGVK
jgi:hypothetical protein